MAVFKIMLLLHLLAAIFAIGPLVHAVTTAARGLRTGDAAATASSARMATIYSYASLLVVIFGFGLMSAKTPYPPHKAVASFGETWIWLSVLLWLIGVAISLAVTVPSLQKATVSIGDGQAIDSLKGKVAGSGGVIGIIFVVIVVLMVYRPGS
ncbi:DUF2269 family protein [Leekyejoonella antrihumi]|uniref:DUF2269 family protein n=1 Tax=Leekyejoonella antrihumi TaxID=1660198 RepID=A0A563E7Y5_9MICO|nr:DUF2269 family protein [Leekyejoonella antrihumi]TWP38646.1 DUF2269 family protein [Leekyejoonella antrihumi]